MFYRNEIELEACLRVSPRVGQRNQNVKFKTDCISPSYVISDTKKKKFSSVGGHFDPSLPPLTLSRGGPELTI